MAIERNSKKKVRWCCHWVDHQVRVVGQSCFRFSLPLLLLSRAAASMLAR